MNILIVGAGAVGSVYGYHLQEGGASVTYLVKPKHEPELKGGLVLYRLHGSSSDADPIRFSGFHRITDPARAKDSKWDAVINTVPSNALRTGDWLKTLLHSLSSETTFLSPNAGITDRDYILSLGGISPEQLVIGSIPIVSYLAPLPGEPFADTGYAYWIPPGAKAMLDGDSRRVEALVAAFRAGEFPAKAEPNFKAKSLMGDVVLRSVVAGLERSEWSFDRFLNGENLQLAASAIEELFPIAARTKDLANPLEKWRYRLLTRPWVLGTVLKFARFRAPMDFEAFMRVHFTKVEDQMHESMKEYLERGRKYHLPTTNLALLARAR